MDYECVDEIINEWVAVHNFTLFTKSGGRACRAVYLSSDEGECCQIWISRPVAGEICIHASDVETKNDAEMRMDWEVPVTELKEALENAVAAVRQWLAR